MSETYQTSTPPFTGSSTCLPTYLVVDASGSMKPHEAMLNSTLANLHVRLATNPRVSEFAHVCLIAFSTDAYVVIPMSDMEQVPTMPEVFCGGATEYGKAFDLVRQCIEYDVSNLRAQQRNVLRPAVFFLTDGAPTDTAQWESAFQRLVDRSWPRRPHVITYGFGDAKQAVLQRVATKALFMANGTDTETALGEAISSLVSSLIQSSTTGRFEIQTQADGFNFIRIEQEYLD